MRRYEDLSIHRKSNANGLIALGEFPDELIQHFRKLSTLIALSTRPLCIMRNKIVAILDSSSAVKQLTHTMRGCIYNFTPLTPFMEKRRTMDMFLGLLCP